MATFQCKNMSTVSHNFVSGVIVCCPYSTCITRYGHISVQELCFVIVHFTKIGAVKGIFYLDAYINFCPYFPFYFPIYMMFCLRIVSYNVDDRL